jgi:isopentenyl-diphosphate delta-isomerase
MAATRKTAATLSAADRASARGLSVAASDLHNGQADIEQRKKDHIDIILSGRAMHRHGNSLDAFEFEHDALPDIAFGAIDLTTEFLGKKLNIPYLASSMTGGPALGGVINRNIAEAAQAMGFAMGVGSQRIALGGGSGHGLDLSVRSIAPDIALYANLGAVQLVSGMTADDARRAVELIAADGLILHLNPLQEAVQAGGDINWKGVGAAIEEVCRRLPVPVIAKEVGAGISPAVAKRLRDLGVAAIDVAGAGGSSWAAVEGLRRPDAKGQSLGETYRNWGISTADCLIGIKQALPAMPLIASGGIRHGLDGAKSIRLGADLVGQAGALLKAAASGAEAVIEHVSTWEHALRIACFCTGSSSLAALQQAPLVRN